MYITISLAVSFHCVLRVRKEYKNYKNAQELQQNQLQRNNEIGQKKECLKHGINLYGKKRKYIFN